MKQDRQQKLDKNKKRYPPARALPLFDRPETNRQRDRRIAAITKKARKSV